MNKQKTKTPLSISHPELSKQWHPTLNGDLTPQQVTYGSNKRVMWTCEKNHTYPAKICHRAGPSKSRCPYCYGKKLSEHRSLTHKRPDLALEFHPILNGSLLPSQIHCSARQKIWWRCSVDQNHEWQSSPDNRNKGNGCPACKNRGDKIDREKSLGALYPHLINEWDYECNEKSPFDVAPFSNEKASWICSIDNQHKWETTICHRAGGTGCPMCSGNRVTDSTSLLVLFPDITKQWHHNKNGTIKPSDVTPGSHIPIWWQCPIDPIHEWRSKPYNRTIGNNGCPYCTNGWSMELIRLFILSLIPHLDTLDQAELLTFCLKNGALNSQGKGRAFIKDFVSGKFLKEELEAAVNDSLAFDEFVEKHSDDLMANDDLPFLAESDLVPQEKDLPIVETKDVLAASESKLFMSADVEIVNFLIESAVAKILRHAFADEEKAIKQCEEYNGDGEYPQRIKNTFLERYQGARGINIPAGYNQNPIDVPKQEQINLMQRYIAHQIETKRRFGNWSETGAGKTLSAILASRVIDSKLTIICCPNNVIDTWQNQIKDSYPNSLMYTKESIARLTHDDNHKYLILNYEFFQQPMSKALLNQLIDRCIIDFMVIDEIHFSKQRTSQISSQRKKLISHFLTSASDKNENIRVLGMSATPVINTLYEGKTLIELITGYNHDEIETRATIANCVALYQKFISHGIRYVPNYKQQLNVTLHEVDCSSFLAEIKSHKIPLELEAILVKAKLPYILGELRPRTIIYSHYRGNGIELMLQEAIANAGWKVALFNGDTKEGLQDFIAGRVDILIASSCIGTGIDGLQKVCNRLIIICLPWTHAEYRQTIGRIYRPGQQKSEVDVIIPLTFAMVNGERWSWCESRWKRISFKKSIADAAVDGVMPEGHLRNQQQAHKDLMDWLTRLDQDGIQTIERHTLSSQLVDTPSHSSIRSISDLSKMNQRIHKESSQDTHTRFTAHPEEWHEYHTAYRAARKTWEVKPYEEAIKWCKARPSLIIGDFGCGEAFLAHQLSNKVHSFDHVAINDMVISCDISHVPLANATLDAAIFSLSLMGTNCIDYLLEANRCLKLDGHLWIAEPSSRISDANRFEELLNRLGFDQRSTYTKGDFIFIQALKSERELNHIALNNFDSTNVLN